MANLTLLYYLIITNLPTWTLPVVLFFTENKYMPLDTACPISEVKFQSSNPRAKSL